MFQTTTSASVSLTQKNLRFRKVDPYAAHRPGSGALVVECNGFGTASVEGSSAGLQTRDLRNQRTETNDIAYSRGAARLRMVNSVNIVEQMS